jgi:hypothetical protein
MKSDGLRCLSGNAAEISRNSLIKNMKIPKAANWVSFLLSHTWKGIDLSLVTTQVRPHETFLSLLLSAAYRITFRVTVEIFSTLRTANDKDRVEAGLQVATTFGMKENLIFIFRSGQPDDAKMLTISGQLDSHLEVYKLIAASPFPYRASTTILWSKFISDQTIHTSAMENIYSIYTS